jgi:hypothetical protein
MHRRVRLCHSVFVLCRFSVSSFVSALRPAIATGVCCSLYRPPPSHQDEPGQPPLPVPPVLIVGGRALPGSMPVSPPPGSVIGPEQAASRTAPQVRQSTRPRSPLRNRQADTTSRRETGRRETLSRAHPSPAAAAAAAGLAWVQETVRSLSGFLTSSYLRPRQSRSARCATASRWSHRAGGPRCSRSHRSSHRSRGPRTRALPPPATPRRSGRESRCCRP